MHEMAICESIRRTLEDEAERQRFVRVQRVCLEIGPFAGVEIEALRFGFEAVMRGSVAQTAVLDIIEPAATAWCLACSKSVPIQRRFDACPACGSHQLQVTTGDELRIKELEVE